MQTYTMLLHDLYTIFDILEFLGETSIIELLGETRIIRIIILIIIIRAGTPLVSHSFNFNWKPKCIGLKIQYKVEGITDERGTSAEYYYLYYYYYYYYTCFT